MIVCLKVNYHLVIRVNPYGKTPLHPLQPCPPHEHPLPPPRPPSQDFALNLELGANSERLSIASASPLVEEAASTSVAGAWHYPSST